MANQPPPPAEEAPPRPRRRRYLLGQDQQVLRRHDLARLQARRQARPPTVRGKTKAEVKDKLDKLHDEINAGIRTPATYTIEQCVKDWLDSIERDDAHDGDLARPGQEVDLSEDRRDQAQGLQRDRRRQVLQATRPIPRQALAGR